MSGSSLDAHMLDVGKCLSIEGRINERHLFSRWEVHRDGKYTASSRLVDGRVSVWVWVWNAIIHEIDPLGRICVASPFNRM